MTTAERMPDLSASSNVIPAKAGIHATLGKSAPGVVDARLRGHDGRGMRGMA